MEDNGLGDNGRVHVMCLPTRINHNYYSKLVLHITEFNYLLQLVPLVFFKFYAHKNNMNIKDTSYFRTIERMH